MKILIDGDKICGLATDAYSGPMQWLAAPEGCDETNFDQYIIQDNAVVFPLADIVRTQRNKLLAETDWRFRSDMTPSQGWIDYCQALRDLPLQEGFPEDVTWPKTPNT
jgi:hypothetical protein